MTGTLLRLLPVVLGIAAGLSLRRLGMLDHRDGETVFKIVFYVFLPALMFMSLSTVRLDLRSAVFPLAVVTILVTGYGAARLVVAKARMDPMQTAVLISACMTVNSGFALPFVQALYGPAGVARIAAFDAVNTTVTFTRSRTTSQPARTPTTTVARCSWAGWRSALPCMRSPPGWWST